jgi:LAS superfamily LD-carboxypeptidase LdcB
MVPGNLCEFFAADGSIVTSRRSWVVIATSLVALTGMASLISPLPTSAQESSSDERDAARRGQPQVDVDVLRADNVEVTDALGDLTTNVANLRAALEMAEAALAEAEAGLGQAETAVKEARAELDELVAETDQVVIEAFVNPPTESALDALTADSLADVSIKQSILNNRATSDAAKLEQLQKAQTRLEEGTANKEQAAAKAAARKSDAEAALAELEAAQEGLLAFVLEVERRLDRKLAEAAAVEGLDPTLAEQIKAREAQLAGVLAGLQEQAQIRAAQQAAEQASAQAAANLASGIRQPPGGVVSVACPTGGSVQVAGDISAAVERLLRDAAADGIAMCGNGFRDPQDQINLRRRNCGSSDYAIFQASSSACSPPTARPGTSMHEQGLAIDFTCGGGGIVSYGDSCHSWLVSNAANYGLFNLPGEPWHWSVNGD